MLTLGRNPRVCFVTLLVGCLTTTGCANFKSTASASRPTITSLSPSGVEAGGPAFTLTVSGSNFDRSSTVSWNGESRQTAFVNPTQITAAISKVDIKAIGSIHVMVVNRNSADQTSPAAVFTISASNPSAAINSISPTSVVAGSIQFLLTVNGSGFRDDCRVTWNDSNLNTFLVSSTELTATVAANLVATAGPVTVEVVDGKGQRSNKATFNVTPGNASDRMPVGTNLSGMDDWSTEFTFVDAFRNSRPWYSRTQGSGQDPRPLELDSRGWVKSLQPAQPPEGGQPALPAQWAETVMFWGLGQKASPGQFPKGRYVVTYSGTGTLVYGGAALLTTHTPGRDTIDVDPARGAGIALDISLLPDQNDYIKDIHVYLPGLENSKERFNPVFLDRIGKYRVVRFMNWMLGQDTNKIDPTQISWSTRPLPDDARWSLRGVPVEIMVELANRVHADPWFTIPHAADDEYLTNFAATVAAELDPGLKVYVEDSNETWNDQYPQTLDERNLGLGMGLGADPNNPGAPPNAFIAGYRYHAFRSAHVFGFFEKVLPADRLVRVLGSHVANPNATIFALAYSDTAKHVDAIAIAPYFGVCPEDLSRVQNMTAGELMNDLETNQTSVCAIPSVLRQVGAQIGIGKKYGIPVLSYEGGQSLTTSGAGALQGDPTLEKLFDATNRDPNIGSLYSRFLQALNDSGLTLLNHYTNCFRYGGPGGRFGSLEYIDQSRSKAPKYDALQRWIEGL